MKKLLVKVKYCRVFFFDEENENLKEVVYLGQHYKISDIKKKTNKKPVKVENSSLQLEMSLNDVDKKLFTNIFSDNVEIVYDED